MGASSQHQNQCPLPKGIFVRCTGCYSPAAHINTLLQKQVINHVIRAQSGPGHTDMQYWHFYILLFGVPCLFLHTSTSHNLLVLFSALSIIRLGQFIMNLYKLHYPGGTTWCSLVPVLSTSLNKLGHFSLLTSLLTS